ncbi:MAG TPA: hypothetical protein VHP58_06265 [Alphaproteobacteria bacterium]|nr:hypothetical protein [Alphaproteobacteria bacterium]
MKTTLTALALTALIAMPAMADEGVMPQKSNIIVSHDTAQQGIGVGKGAHSGKMHKKHMGKKHSGKHHGKKHHGAAKKAAK